MTCALHACGWPQISRQMDDIEIVDTDEANNDALAAYYADGSNKDHDKNAVFDPYLGLAVEQLKGNCPPRSVFKESNHRRKLYTALFCETRKLKSTSLLADWDQDAFVISSTRITL